MLYAIGDDGADIERQFDLFSTFHDIEHLTFDELMRTEKTIDSHAGIILFFPHLLWNSFVETNDALYGVKGFEENIGKLKKHLCKKLTQVFPRAFYVNKPGIFALERDKVRAKSLLEQHQISVVPGLPKDISVIKNELKKGGSVYIKVRFGSMGKGITRLVEGQWLTNFRYVDGEISNHPCDFEWRTRDVTNDYSFLRKLLIEDVLVEMGVETPKDLGTKFDIRGVFVYGKLAELYGRASSNPLMTNLSQGGGCLEPNDLIELIGAAKLAEAVAEMQNANRVFETNLLGVDLTFDNMLKPYVMEVNSFPGLGHGIKEEDIRDTILKKVHLQLTQAYKRNELVNQSRPKPRAISQSPNPIALDQASMRLAI